MNSYDYKNNVLHNKIASLEDKVNRLEGIIRYGNQDEYYFTKSPSHYKSAVHLSNATRNLKQDLLRNPHHNKLDRDDYQQIYDRVSFLEKELSNILNDMDSTGRVRSSYNYIENMESSSMYCDGDPMLQPRGYNTRKRIIQKEPQRKRVSYDRYVEVIPQPSDTSSSESIEEIIYYIDSPTSSSSSSTSVIIEEYVPKHYTRRNIRRSPPIIDVSKSKPRHSVNKSQSKTKTRHKRRSRSERAEVKNPKIKKSKKDKKALKVEGTESASEMPDESDIYLVKRTKESPKKEKNQDKKEKYYVSRLTKVDSSDDGEQNEDKLDKESKPSSAKEKSRRDKTNLSQQNSKSKKRSKETKQRDKSYESQTNQTKLKKNKRRVKEKSQKVKQPKESIIVARSSFVLNDPFVSTIYYDNFVSSGEDNKTSLSSNHNTSDYYGVKGKILNNKSESGAESFPQTNTYNASKYEMSNSFYTFDPYFKRKEKFYRTYNLNKRKSDENDNSGEQKTIFYNVDKNGIIVLNNDNLKTNKNKCAFKQTNKSNDIDQIISYGRPRPKGNGKKYETGEKLSSCFDEKRNSKIAYSKKPIAHSVYLTTVPVYQPSGLLDLQVPFHPPKKVRNQGESNSKASTGSNSRIPEITSHHRTILEDEIVMNVAKKLSPVVAEMITNSLSRSKEESKTRVLSPTKNSNNLNNSNVYEHDNLSDTQSNDFNDYNVQCKSIRGKIPKEKVGKYISEKNRGKNEIFIEVINSSNKEIKKPFTESHVSLYYATMDNNSPLQQKPSTKKSALKKLNSISSIKSLFRKQSKGKIKKSMTGKPPENLNQDRPSTQYTNTHQQKHGSQINQKEEGTRQQRESASEEEEEQSTNHLQNVPSFDSAQNTEPNKSIVKKRGNKMNRKKSSSRFKSILSRMSSREKQEPAPKSLLSRMKSGDKQSQVHALRYSENKPVLPVGMKSRNRSSKVLNKEQNQKPHKQSQIYSKQDSDEDLTKQSKRNSENVNVTTMNNMNYSNQPKIIYKSEKNTDNSNYTGSQENLKEFKSIPQYELAREQNTLLEDSNLRKVINQASGLQSEEIITQEISKTNREDDYPCKMFPAECELQHVSEEARIAQEDPNQCKICPKECPSKHLCEEAGIEQEVQDNPKKPLHFCIHFSKEKRSKFESQSTSSLDDILFSQCKKVYSTEELSLSEYQFDENKGSYKTRKIQPKKQKDYFKLNQNCASPCGQLNKYYDSFMKEMNSVSTNSCCCKNLSVLRSEQLISDSSYSLDWHKVANELKHSI